MRRAASAIGALLLVLLPLSAVRAQTQALDECARQVANRSEMPLCLALAQRTANDDMLDALRQVLAQAESLARATGRDGGAAQLRASQREFERYVDAQCRFVHALFDSGNGADQAALACEVDLLRQRVTVLRGFLPQRPGAN